MNKLIAEQPFIIDSLMQNLCSKINLIENKITNISNRRKKEQIADFLFLLIKQNYHNKVDSISINYSVSEIGDLIGISRSYVNKVLRDYEKKAILRISRKEIMIYDINALSIVAEPLERK